MITSSSVFGNWRTDAGTFHYESSWVSTTREREWIDLTLIKSDTINTTREGPPAIALAIEPDVIPTIRLRITNRTRTGKDPVRPAMARPHRLKSSVPRVKKCHGKFPLIPHQHERSPIHRGDFRVQEMIFSIKNRFSDRKGPEIRADL